MKVTKIKIYIIVISMLSLYYFFFYKETFSTNMSENSQFIKNNIKLLTKPYNLTNDYNDNDNDSDEILNMYINKHLKNTTPLVKPDLTQTLTNESLKTLHLLELNHLKLILKRIHDIESMTINDNPTTQSTSSK